MTINSHTMNVEFHLGIELHSCVELHNKVEAHSDSKISGNVELLTKMYIVILKLRDKLNKLDLNQDCPNMSRYIILLQKSLEKRMPDQ